MRELNVKEIEQVNGGRVAIMRILIATAGAFLRSGSSDGEYLYNGGNFRKN